MANSSTNEIDTFEDVELDTLMSLLGDDGMFPLPCESNGCDLSMNDSGTTLDSLDDIMEFHDCFDNLPDDFDTIPQFNIVDDTNTCTIPIEPANVASSIEPTNVPSTSSMVPTNVPSTSSVVPTNIDTGLMSTLLLNAILSNSVNMDQLLHTNMETTVAKEPQTDLCSLQHCVQHDHTYASDSGTGLIASATGDGAAGKGSSNTSGDKSSSDVEEGSSSDTGYDTMSTSPSSSSTIDQPSPSHPSPSLSLPSDPVKLIDERIKFFMSRQQEVKLSTEEKETLKAEGLPIPTTLPLTKTEERALKSVRRKIRNKVAAQESRKKKKEYIDQLEDRVKLCTDENSKLKKKVDTLETENKTLMQQLAQLQALVARANPILGRPFHVGTGLMVIVLCFGILFGNLIPYKVSITSTDYTTVSAVRSRALLSVPEEHHNGFMSYFGSLFLGHSHMTTPIESTSIDEERHVHWMVDIDNLTSSHSPVIMAKA